MAHAYLEILRTEINVHLCRVLESRRDFDETIALTLKSIDESRALMAEIDAIIAKRLQPIEPSNKRVHGRLVRLTDREEIAQAKNRTAQVIHLPVPARAVPPAATVVDLKRERRRIQREARLQRAINEAWRQAKTGTPDADFSALFCAARARLSTHAEFGPDFQEARHRDRER
jgi:hypothetical protein